MKTLQLVKKKITLVLVASIYMTIGGLAQISQGGEPYNWNDKRIDTEIPYYNLPELDIELLTAQDVINDQHKELPFRFGVEHEVSLNVENSGRWTSLNNGYSIWQLGIYCPEATTISLLLDQYTLPKGAKLFLSTADRVEFLGGFDYRNNDDSGVLPTGILNGEKIVVELLLQDDQRNGLKFSIGQIIHGYRSVLRSENAELSGNRGPFGSSGSCHNNVNCPVGANWQVEKRAVAMIVEGGFAICTGALVNNTANDGTPYFLTANHCLPNTNNANTLNNTMSNWVFYFNHESSTCGGTSGPTNQTVSGATFRAKRGGSDFALIRLNSAPPANYNPLYAGWDATDIENVSNAVGIHHPSGDVKKISFENNAPSKATYGNTEIWWIQSWEDGVTEGGSSGSPLFNEDHRIVGQLYAGSSACQGNTENNGDDVYGRFGISWNTGNSSSSRLKEWLDPGNTGTLILNSYPDGFVQFALDASANNITGVPEVLCGNTVNPIVTLRNNGTQTLTSCTITYQLNSGVSQTYNWTGSLAQNQTTNVSLPGIAVSTNINTLSVSVSNPNGGTDQNAGNNTTSVSFTAIFGETHPLVLTITFDQYPTETSWQLLNSGSQIVYSSNGATYSNDFASTTIEIDLCLQSGCYTLRFYDNQNDGICCQYGNGSYSLKNEFGAVLASGGDFNNVDVRNFCLLTSDITDESENNYSIFPNPANNLVTIKGTSSISSIVIHDISGRMVQSIQPNTMQVELSTLELSNGVYTCEITSEAGTKVEKLVIRH